MATLQNTVLLALLVLGFSSVNSYRILAVFPFEIRSHRGVLDPIAEELASRGHQIDVISPFNVSKPTPKYKNIITMEPLKKPRRMTYEATTQPDKDREFLHMMNGHVCDLLGHPVFSKILKNPPNDPPYDLVLLQVNRGFQCLTAIGHVWDIPLVVIVTTTLYPNMNHYIDNPINLATAPTNLQFYKEEMNFWERLRNFFMTHRYIYNHYRDQVSLQDYYIKKYLGENMPSFMEIEKKSVSMVLTNSHYSYHGVKPKSPALVEIGGINIKVNDTTKISPDLKKILDESKDGFIFFSFGSNVIIESLPHDVLERFYKAIRKIAPIRVIMKAPQPDLMPKNMPKNVWTSSWLPQQQILNHPNIKGFVMHGGALGTYEAIYYKVPMICVPFFADQYLNCDISTSKNVSIKLDIRSAKDEDYEKVFNEILKNPLYKKSVDKLSALFWDRPQTPREATAYWIEYVIRHGKNVLRSPAAKLQWWQIELFDIYAFILACAFALLVIVYWISRLLYRFAMGKSPANKDKTGKSSKKTTSKKSN